MPYFTTPDNCKLYFATDNFEADRPVLALLNGTCQTTVYWEPHAAAFARHFRVMRYDARAQGKSDIGAHPLSVAIHINDLQHLLAHLKVAKAHLVGISHGAFIALMMAATAPECVDRLVLCSIGIDSQAFVKHIVHSWLQILQRTDLQTLAWSVMPLVFGKRFLNQNHTICDKIVAAIAARNSKQALLAHFNAMGDYPALETIVHSIQCETLIISGSDDPIVSPPDARQLADGCRGRHEMFPQTGHSVPAESPSLFQQIILDFLKQP